MICSHCKIDKFSVCERIDGNLWCNRCWFPIVIESNRCIDCGIAIDRGIICAKCKNRRLSEQPKGKCQGCGITIHQDVNWCQECGRRRRASRTMRDNRSKGIYDGVYQSPTHIEIVVSKALDELNIKHKSQFRPKGYSKIFDEYIPPRILLEVHGTYWHSLEKAQINDAKKKAWALRNGYILIVIWEHELKEQKAETLISERVIPLL